jgi:hypothetical protein
MTTFNEFLEERIASGDLWHRQSLQALFAALNFSGWEFYRAAYPEHVDQRLLIAH